MIFPDPVDPLRVFHKDEGVRIGVRPFAKRSMKEMKNGSFRSFLQLCTKPRIPFILPQIGSMCRNFLREIEAGELV